MNCGFHPDQRSVVSCQSCRRPLCGACDHRIKGIPYCQECIVSGIELLRLRSSTGIVTTAPIANLGTSMGASPGVRSRRSVVIAFIFSLFPGLGAIYNGQNVKAMLHFMLIAGSWTLADIFSESLGAIFFFSGLGVYLFSIFDACRSAQRSLGEYDLAEADEEIRNKLREKTHLAGLGLILIGTMVIANTLFPTMLNRFWPVLLIAIGIFLLRFRAPRQSTVANHFNNQA